ncbi:MAG: WG repeat-containing protein [Ruminococcus sp.]
MNKHSRVIVIFLLIILSVLCAAIILFRIDVGKDAGGMESSSSLSVSSDGNSVAIVYKDSSGMYGLKDKSGNIILEPEWAELVSLGGGSFCAKLVTRLDTLYGVIDWKGDIIVPFVYDEITRISDYLYSARLRDSGKYHFYGTDLSLLMNGSADSFFLEGTNLFFKQGEDTFTYKQGEKLSLVRAELPRYKRPVDIDIKVENPDVLSVMDCAEWSSFGDSVITILDAVRRNKPELLAEASERSVISDILSAIKEMEQWKGRISDNTYVYTVDSNGETIVYLNTELIWQMEDETECSVPLELGFMKNETEEWLLSEAVIK